MPQSPLPRPPFTQRQHAIGRAATWVALSTFALLASAATPTLHRYTGVAYAHDGGQLLYREQHWIYLDHGKPARLVLYSCPDGKAFARKHLDGPLDSSAPDFDFLDARSGYPDARISAVSNSHSQRKHIEEKCHQLDLSNVKVIIHDVNQLELEPAQFDRCVSIEMFEHMRNYQTLLNHVASWLKPGGKLFVHIFAHRTLMYPFETEGEDNWMGRHFFTGGLMPASDTLLWFQRDLDIEQRWHVNGTHYQRSADRWLQRQDNHRDAIMATLTEACGDNAKLWFQRWRMFWMSCAELFGYDHGQEWLVAHYRFVRPQ